MKKFLLLMAFSALSSATVTANATAVTEQHGSTMPECLAQNTLPGKETPNKIELADNERIMGFYDTDYLPSNNYGFSNWTGTEIRAAVVYPTSLIKNFVGGKITRVRFGLAASIGAVRLFIAPYSETGDVGEEVVSVDVPSTQYGWNEATLPEPLELDGTTAYMVGFEYTQKKSGSDYETRPLLSDRDVPSDCGFMIYGDITGYGSMWMNFTPSYGSLCIQAVVQNDNFTAYDVALSSLSTVRYTKAGNDIDYSFRVKKTRGTTAPDSYTLAVAVDGKVIERIETPVALTDDEYIIRRTCSLGNESKRYELSVYVDKINGETPDAGGTDNDTLKTKVAVYVSDGVQRTKHLVEHFTSQYCTNCPQGYPFLELLTETYDDIALVSMHQNMTAGNDIFTVEETKYLGAFASCGLPCAIFNRYYSDDTSLNTAGSLAMPIIFSDRYLEAAVSAFRNVLEESDRKIPSFTTVNITSSLNKATNTVSIKVSGTALDDFFSMIGEDAKLTVYLTEDGLRAKQLDGTIWIDNFEHNHVLRAIPTNYFGDPINWNGNTFENDFTVKLDSDWNTDNMSIIAFVGKNILMEGINYLTALDDAEVNQTNSVKLGENTTTAIKNVASADENGTEVARYSLDGRKLNAPVKGINIVKLSNGKTVKVVVKE